jgi:predicted lipoprotein with Yx(FWY)xxD motif
MVERTIRRPAASPTRVMALMCGVVLALGAYGFSASAASAAAKPKVTVATATVPGVGTVLVDAQGHTLYTLTNNGAAVACTGTCAAAWPPLTVAAGAKVKGAKGTKSLGVTTDTNQATAAGLPLYRFAGDTKAKQANGEGLNSFGGTWHVVKASGGKATTKTTSTTSGSSGY